MQQPLPIAKSSRTLFLLPGLANRHGLITGATGTGKTVSLQVMAEGFSAIGVPVFMADVKGDLSGLSQAGHDQPQAQGAHRRTRSRRVCLRRLSGHVLGRFWRTGPSGARHRLGNGSAAAGAPAESERHSGRCADAGVQDRRRQPFAAARPEGPAFDGAVRRRQRQAVHHRSTATFPPPASARSSAGCSRSTSRAATVSSASRRSTSPI